MEGRSSWGRCYPLKDEAGKSSGKKAIYSLVTVRGNNVVGVGKILLRGEAQDPVGPFGRSEESPREVAFVFHFPGFQLMFLFQAIGKNKKQKSQTSSLLIIFRLAGKSW